MALSTKAAPQFKDFVSRNGKTPTRRGKRGRAFAPHTRGDYPLLRPKRSILSNRIVRAILRGAKQARCSGWDISASVRYSSIPASALFIA